MANSRRSFLSLLVAAPAALPVIAKEAAGKLGLQGVLGTAASFSFSPAPPQGLGNATSRYSESWARTMIRTFWRPSQQRNRRMNARELARRLDPDLAAMRSLSPAAAYRIQVGRCEKQIEHDNMEIWQEQLADEAADRMGL